MKRQLFTIMFVTLLFVGLWLAPQVTPLIYQFDRGLSSDTVSFKGTVMTMPYQIIIEAPVSEMKKKKITQEVKKIFDRIDNSVNLFNAHSLICNLNSNQTSAGPFQVDSDFYKIAQIATDVWSTSSGLFDPTVCSITHLWRSHMKKGIVPPKELREDAESIMGWGRVHLLPGQQIGKDNPKTQIDLNSVAKGYTVDLICKALEEMGYKHIFVEWAGEIRVKGGHPSNREWVVGIKTPRKGDYNFLAKVQIQDGALATSGHDEFHWLAIDDDGQTHSFSHLMSPTLKRPLYTEKRKILSCSVIASSCALADGLATTGMLFEKMEDAQEWAKRIIEKWPTISIFLFTHDQQMIHFAGRESIKHHTIGTIDLYQTFEV